MYNRGGKVWVGEKGQGLVFLENDWDNSRLPQDLVEEAGLLGTDFKLLSLTERAKLGGYACKENSILFWTDVPTPPHSPSPNSVFLAWEGNDWLSSTDNASVLELKKADQGGYSLEVSLDSISKSDEFSFKFKSSDDQWIEPPDFIPCQSEPMPGVRNFHFSKKRTGKDVLRFRIVDETSSQAIDRWLVSRPQNLGATFKDNHWTFRLFAPRAKQVYVLLYKECGSEISRICPMKLRPDGVWESNTNLEKYENAYLFKITHELGNEESKEFSKLILDPYAKCCINREGPGLLVNSFYQKTSPKAYNPPDIKDLVIVEAHIRDILAKAPTDISEKDRTGFTGLTKWLNSENCYLKKLGANAVELQPIQQFDSRKKDQYHWGYMPVNYFCPSSDYATAPQKSLQEFGEMVEAFHNAGIAVILDVVYNHMGIPNHLLNIDRELYLLTDDLGRLTNHSGCGNDLRCDSGAVKKLVIDSLKYWIETFDVDGFRFDLGELLGIELLKEIETEIRKIKPGAILIAEPWSFRGRLPNAMNQTGYSLWSDRSRENLLLFLQENQGIEKIQQMMKGQLDQENRFPWQSVNYCESHDDYAFIDRICSENEEGGLNPNQQAISKAKLALVVLFLSPGVPMISAGQDFLRSKRGIRNTYENGEINALDYERLIKFNDFSQEIRALIRFRLSDRGLFTRPNRNEDCIYANINCGSNYILSFTVRHKNHGEEFLFLCNPSPITTGVSLPSPWTETQAILPTNPEVQDKEKLLPWEYRLLVRKLK